VPPKCATSLPDRVHQALENPNQPLVRLTTQNLQEAIAARRQQRDARFED